MPELGTKHECFSCGAKFYDLGKPEAICPKCGANQKDAAAKGTVETAATRRRRREVEEGHEEVEVGAEKEEVEEEPDEPADL